LERSPCGVLDAAVAADGREASYTTHGDPSGVSPLNAGEHYISIDELSVSTEKRKIQAFFLSFFRFHCLSEHMILIKILPG